jgi:hypothetical protein
MNLILLEDAEIEFVESVLYYESKEEGLGVRFKNEISKLLEWVRDNSEFAQNASERV